MKWFMTLDIQRYGCRKYLIILGLVFLVSAQIILLFTNILDEKTLLNYSMKNNELEHIYSNDMRWEMLKREMRMIEISNKSFYNELLDIVVRRSVNETLSKLNVNSERNASLYAKEVKLLTTNKYGHAKKREDLLTKSETASTTKSTVDALQSSTPVIKQSKTVMGWDSQNCSVNISTLRGLENVSNDYHGFNFLEKKFNDTEIGGRWRPKNCTATQRIAIIIPYRDRDTHLKLLLHNLIPKLRRQKVDYTFYLMEQGHGSKFNRGMMRNIGFLEARKQARYDCYIFNDVDTLIENDRNIYTCKDKVAYHMAASVDIFNYTIPYGALIGGILGFKEELFVRANGYSNFYFMWGAEDDDMWRRIHRVKGAVHRPHANLSRVTTLKHERDPKIWERVNMYHRVSYFVEKDGLSSLNYSVVFMEKRKLYTWIYVKVNETYYHELLEKYKAIRAAEIKAKEKEKTTTAKSEQKKDEKNVVKSKQKEEEKNTDKSKQKKEEKSAVKSKHKEEEKKEVKSKQKEEEKNAVKSKQKEEKKAVKSKQKEENKKQK